MIESVMLPLSQLKRLPRNPKDHHLQLIHESIDEFGFIDRIVINKKTGHIISGHCRVNALQQLKAAGKKPPVGIKPNGKDWHVPADYVDIPANKEEKAAIALNRIPEMGGWRDDLLAEVLSDYVASNDLKGSGYSDSDVDELLNKLSVGNKFDSDKIKPSLEKAVALQAKWKTKTNQIWKAGGHVLVCGDSADHHILVDGVITDPPYDMESSRVREILELFAKRAIVLSGQKQAFTLVGGRWRFSKEFVWLRRTPRSYPTDNMPVIYHNWAVVVMASDKEKLGWKRPRPDFKSVIELESEYTESELGHGKNHELFSIMLEGFAFKKWADPFMGSGGTVLACEEQGKCLFGVEKDPVVFAVALERISKAGLKPELAE